ncbi:MAG: hypothetical protein IPP40_13330 [bacterium]|nr:hypothetical protein [bacterium]
MTFQIQLNPTELGAFTNIDFVQDVAVAGNYAYVADFVAGLYIIDISNPTNPIELGHLNQTTNCNSVEVSGDYAYFTTGGGLTIAYVANPMAPIAAGTFDSPDWTTDVSLSNNLALVSCASGIRIIDVTNVTHPEEVGYYHEPNAGYGLNISVAGTFAFLADGRFKIVDFSDPTQPVLIGLYQTNLGVSDVSVRDSIAIVVANRSLRAGCFRHGRSTRDRSL